MFKLFTPFIGPVFDILKQILGPMIAYFKGRSDAKRDIRLKSIEAENAAIEKGNRAGRDAAASGELRDKYFRD